MRYRPDDMEQPVEIFGNLERLIDDIYPYRWFVAMLAAVAALLLATVVYRYGWHLVIARHRLRAALIAVPLLVIAIPVSYYLLSPLWTRTTIYEESPLAAVGVTVAGVPAATTTSMSMNADTMAAIASPTTELAMTTTTTEPTPTTAPDPPVAASEPTSTDEPPPPATNEPEVEPITEPTPERPIEPISEPTVEPAASVFTPLLVSSGPLSGADDFHFAEGTALLIETEPGVYVLRLEEFSVRNGPDLFVYLSASPDYLDDVSINLGELRATDGSINYDVPPGTDIAQFQGVVIWCRAFAVFFGSAPLIAS
jgi:hypothetical protein